jgi:hypothetical protein
MSFRELAAQLASTAFTVADDIPESCLYKHGGSSRPYDTKSGKVLQSSTAAESTVSFIFGPAQGFGTPDGDTTQSDHTGDLSAVAQAAEFNQTPAEGDELVRGVDEYRVIALKPDEAGATYTFLIARIGGGIEP